MKLESTDLPEYEMSEVPFYMPFIPLYALIVEFEDGDVELVKGKRKGGPIVATESNQYLLREIGDRLLEKKLIIGYQLVKTVSWPTREV